MKTGGKGLRFPVTKEIQRQKLLIENQRINMRQKGGLRGGTLEKDYARRNKYREENNKADT